MAVPPQPVLYPSSNDAATSAAIALLIHYFDLAPASAQLLVKKWLSGYPAIWVRAAVTEALYQGRYKPVSVEQILTFWQRRGRSIVHFNKEFETLIAVPLQGSFKTETDVAIEGNDNATQTATAEPLAADLVLDSPDLRLENDQRRNWAALPDMTLAEAFDASAEQKQLAQGSPAAGQLPPSNDLPSNAPSNSALPRPRLMLPGELPGKELVQPAAVSQSIPEAPPGNAAASRQSDESDEVLGSDAHPPNIPEPGPADPAMLSAVKPKPIQPPPIGRFTPAADPSGFASRLKTVVQQAVAQTQAGEAQLSLETAIASQLASDPVLGNASSANDGTGADSAPAMPEVLAAPFADRFAMASPADSAAEAKGSAFRDELDLELDALALESNTTEVDVNGPDSSELDASLRNPPPLASPTNAHQTGDTQSSNIGAEVQPEADTPETAASSPAAAAAPSDQVSPEQVSPPPDQTAEPPSSRAVEIADVSNLMAGLTTVHQLGADEVTLSLEDIGIRDAKPIPEEDGRTGSDQT